MARADVTDAIGGPRGKASPAAWPGDIGQPLQTNPNTVGGVAGCAREVIGTGTVEKSTLATSYMRFPRGVPGNATGIPLEAVAM